MTLKDRIKANLLQVREMSGGILSAFQTPEDWTHQVHPKANHALWIIGHLSHADNFFLTLLGSDKSVDKEGWSEMFGMGSQPSADPSAYPPVAEVLEFFRERRETLLGVLDGMPEADLDNKTPEGSPGFLSDFGQVFETAVWHEGVHTGQLTVAHRSLGNPPLFTNPEPASA